MRASSSITTLAFGISRALAMSGVSLQSAATSAGLAATIFTSTSPRQRATIFPSSSRLADEHGQCGCRNITSVGSVLSCVSATLSGQRADAAPVAPGTNEYPQSTRTPAAAAISQTQHSINVVVGRDFFTT